MGGTNTPDDNEKTVQDFMEHYDMNHDDAALLFKTVHQLKGQYKKHKDSIADIIVTAYKNGKCIAESFGRPYSFTEFIEHFTKELNRKG